MILRSEPIRLLSTPLLAALFTVALVSMAPQTASAQSGTANEEQADDKEEKKTTGRRKTPKKAPYVMLPKPLEDVESNVPMLAETDLFKILDVEFGYIGEARQRGISWTLQVERRVTVKRALLLLRNLRDVKFYIEGKYTKKRQLIHRTVLEYSAALDVLASRGSSLLPNEKIKVWIPLTDIEQRRIRGNDVNRMVLGRLRPGLD